MSETAETPIVQPHPRCAAPTVTPTSARGTKCTREPSIVASSAELPRDGSGSDSSEPDEPPPYQELKRAMTTQVWRYKLRKYERWYLETC